MRIYEFSRSQMPSLLGIGKAYLLIYLFLCHVLCNLMRIYKFSSTQMTSLLGIWRVNLLIYLFVCHFLCCIWWTHMHIFKPTPNAAHKICRVSDSTIFDLTFKTGSINQYFVWNIYDVQKWTAFVEWFKSTIFWLKYCYWKILSPKIS